MFRDKKDDIFTTSEVIAEHAEVQHHAVQQLISTYQKDFEEFGIIAFEMRKPPAGSKGGRPEMIYHLNEQQATLLMTYLRNNEVVRNFKKELVRQFYAMRELLMRQKLERQTEAWQTARIEGKKTRRLETDAIKLFVEYAKANGSKNPDKYYINSIGNILLIAVGQYGIISLSGRIRPEVFKGDDFMKKQWKGFLTGFLTAALLLCLGSPAFAATVRQLNATFNNIKITIDGTEFVPKDFNGNKLEPFTVDGATYLPVRAVAEALGLTVEWDQAAQTVKLTRPGSQNTSSTGTVIMDQNGVRITFLGFAPKPTGFKGYDIKLSIENNSGKNYTVQVRDLSVNGIMADSIFSCDVAAGKTANDSIWVYNMEERGITVPVTTADLTFHVFGTDDWSDSFDSAIITVK